MEKYAFAQNQGNTLTILARMVLNYKGIDYKTKWVEYPDLVPTLKALGLPPNDPNERAYGGDYTSPAIQYEDGTLSMDSLKIAHELERRYPSPSLHLDDPIVDKVRLAKIFEALIPHIMPKVPRVLLNPVSAEYYELTREEQFGMPLTLFEQEKATEECWEQAKGPIKGMSDLLKKNGGPFFLGDTGMCSKTWRWVDAEIRVLRTK
jgi:glutathione S-transferase